LNQKGYVKATTLLLLGITLLHPASACAQRLETGVFFTYAFLEEIGSNDHEVGTSTAGLGCRLAWRLLPFLDIDTEVAVHPTAGVSGYKVQGFAGAKVGGQFGRVGLFAKVRPGFLYFSKDPFGVGRRGATFPETVWAHSLEPAMDVGVVIEYFASHGVAVRFDLADTIVRYDSRRVFVSQREPLREVGGFTTRNRQWSIGLGKRF
jgi:hypothetical protein